jgi:hypothetical protein
MARVCPITPPAKREPIGAELKFHGDAGHHAHDEVNSENARPEACRLVIEFVIAAQRQCLQHNNQRRQAHRQLREEIVKSNREGEVQAVNQECAIHNGNLKGGEDEIMTG